MGVETNQYSSQESVRYVKLDSENHENPLLVWIGHADCQLLGTETAVSNSCAWVVLLISDASPPGDDVWLGRREMQAICPPEWLQLGNIHYVYA